jgi:lipopolysaccharide export system permease protein
MLKILDRYILGKFIKTFVFSISLILLIFIVFDIKEKLSTFTTKQIPLNEIVFDYYLMFLPYYGNYFSPMFTFISVVFFTSKMAHQSEFIAILSSGTSFNRILRPYIIGAMLIGLTSLALNHFVIPKAFEIKIGFEDKYINNGYSSDAQNIHKKIGANKLLYLESYDNRINTAYKVSIEEIVNNKQIYYLSCNDMVWDSVNKNWIMSNVYERRLIVQNNLDTLKNQKPLYRQTAVFTTTKTISIPFTPEEMWRYESKIETMNYWELKDYIQKETLKGSDMVAVYEIESYRRTSFPFATFILTMIGVCVSSKKVRGGVGIQIALGLFLSSIYIMLMYVFTTIAKTGFAPPLIAVWIPNLIFSAIAFYFYSNAQK